MIRGKSIEYAGSKALSPPSSPGDIVASVPCVMPGMWDCHVHFMGLPNDPKGDMMDCFLKTPVEERAARMVGHAAKALDAGFTSVRDVGGMGGYLKVLIDGGEIPGPHIYSAFDMLSMSGGHADLQQFPSECMSLCRSHVGCLCDGEAECLKGVRAQLRKGADLIKVCASGGVMSERDSPLHQQFSDGELRAIVEEAARAGRIVAAHCHGTAGIMAALRAGCRTIEHGSFLDEASVRLMAEKGTVLVPTRWIIEQLAGGIANGGIKPADLSAVAFDKVCFIYDRHLESIKLAWRSGVKIACGTDMFLSRAWGRNGEELGYYVNKVGMTELEAIETATANGPLTVGEFIAPKSGLLMSGYDADVITLSASPLDGNIAVLANPDNVTMVIKSGKVAKMKLSDVSLTKIRKCYC